MKTTMKFLTYSFLALIMVVSFSCSPEDGADGAQGPAGTAGQDGINGQDGNANVIYSNWTGFDSTNWEALANEFSTEIRNYPVTVNDLTQDIADNGVILVYIKFNGFPNTTIPLPFTGNITGGINFLYYYSNVSLITLKLANLDGNGDPGIFGAGNFYRYILIPGGTLAKSTSEINYKNMSYEEVMDRFGLDY
jgi:hypothetical protein